ncbi:HlyD family secretion protein [Aliikangiella maris]|uniref:HlyD family efflux transporter periplasmic adaptor subunit n=2 Tax=Aliikangiella maris TaxID=3162458 RepID=A0ABV2BYQ5_9GAMM
MRHLTVLLLMMILTACNEPKPTIALGTLERDRIAHTATMNEVITELPIQQGSHITKGTVLVKLDNTLQNAIVAKARADVAQAQAQFEKLKNGARDQEIAAARAAVSGAKAKLKESEASFKRITNLIKNKLSSQADLDHAVANRDANKANLESAQEQLSVLIKGTREEDLRMAEAQMAAANAVLTSELKKLDDLTIRATRDGILDNLPWNLGERVTIGSPIAIVLAGEAPYARVYIPQTHRVGLKVGDSIDVKVDGISSPLAGKISWIANEPAFSPYYALNQQERSRLMYLTKIQLSIEATDLPNGVPVQALLVRAVK